MTAKIFQPLITLLLLEKNRCKINIRSTIEIGLLDSASVSHMVWDKFITNQRSQSGNV